MAVATLKLVSASIVYNQNTALKNVFSNKGKEESLLERRYHDNTNSALIAILLVFFFFF